MNKQSVYRRWKHGRRVVLNTTAAMRAARRFNHPERGLRLIGITGTDGKTTTANMLAAILRADGRKVGLISTLGAEIDGTLMDTGLHVSTPGPKEIYELLAKMKERGVTDVVVEVTSHALDQRRVFGMRFEVAVVTNITPEHLDYHGTFAAYVKAKSRLVGMAKVAVLNREDGSTDFLAQKAKKVVLYGIGSGAGIRADKVEFRESGSVFTVKANQFEPFEVRVFLPGRYNVLNALAAIGAARELGVDTKTMVEGLSHVTALSGRWEVIQDAPFVVIVDFAHTPHAFEEALPAARRLVGAQGRLIHVFGCAGLRDKGKRIDMGRISGALADLTVLTIEDPRTEDIERIQQMVIEGLEESGKRDEVGWRRIDDRGEAIEWAIRQAKPGDVVVITGKGHEKSLAIGRTEHPWSDQVEVRAVLDGKSAKRLLQ